LLQLSALPMAFGTQLSAPVWQVIVPVAQTPSWPVWHAAPPCGLPSSVCPLQSLSSWSHTSAEAGVMGKQSTTPAWHWILPAKQTPRYPVEQSPPVPGTASSI